jgi:PAS domain S-box-containing protein
MRKSSAGWIVGPLRECALAAVLTGAATSLRWLVDPLLGDSAQFVTFFVAVVIAGAVSGWRSAQITAVLSAAVVAFTFMELPLTKAHFLALGIFLVAASFISWIAGTMHAERRASRRQAEAVEEALEQKKAALEAADLGTWTTILESGELSGDERAGAIFGAKGEKFEHREFLEEVHPEDRKRVSEAFQAALDPSSKGRYEIEYRIVRPDSSVRWISARGQACFGGEGKDRKAERVSGTIMDVTDRKMAEEAVRESREDLKRAQAVAQIGSWRLDVRRNELRWSDETYRIFGIPPGTSLTYETFLGAVHADDRERVDRGWKATLFGEPYDLDHRIVVNGEVKWVREKANLEFDQWGTLLGGFGTVQDITERKHVEEALTAAKATAEEASRAKDHFMAVLSHELRTPLTAVIPALGALEDHILPGGAEYLDMARRNVEMEARLIDDLLDVTRIARGKVELDMKPADLCTILRHAVEVCAPDIEARRQQLRLKFDGEPHIVLADPSRLQQVFWNLLKNSVKFTPLGGRIGIRAWREQDRAFVQVDDSGEGIEPEAMVHIFSAFAQAEHEVRRKFGGLGLGLSISKALVEMHGGTIRAYSEGRDKGATFTVELPLAKEAETAAVPRAARVRQRPLKILLVEDHGDTAKILARLLQVEGHEVTHAGDVATALKLAGDAWGFDLLISDLGLPDGTGYDLMHELTARQGEVAAIALSGYGMAEDVERSMAAGFKVHITKPVGLRKLQEAIAGLVGSRA